MFGKPMISCEIGTGSSFINMNGETGYTVKPQDQTALAIMMNQLLGDPALARSLGAAARARYSNWLTADIMASKYAGLYLRDRMT